MRIADLFDRHHGQDIYIVGTGPSLRLLPVGLLSGRTTIGLNQAWRMVPGLHYCLTAHPELTLEWEESRPEGLRSQAKTRPGIDPVWIVKQKAPMANLSFDDPRYYVWTSDKHPHEDNLKYVRKRVPDYLYQGRGIQQTGMNLAAHMGARSIILVGCDMTDLGGDHHAHAQHVRFHGLDPKLVYKEYRVYTARVRQAIWDTWRIPTLTLTPFVGVGHAEEDYARLCQERALEKLPAPEDTSKYQREPPKL
jgi:hypothetical protein